jgi:uncharacterized protein (UPF0332 family)
VALAPNVQAKIAARLRLASGLIETCEVTSSSTEYDIRNCYSRLYYAFFHASLALLLSTDPDIERVSGNHGVVHERIQRRFGKTMTVTRTIRQVYGLRRESDYETDMFVIKYRGNIEEARKEATLFLKRAKTDFYWIYYEARKTL